MLYADKESPRARNDILEGFFHAHAGVIVHRPALLSFAVYSRQDNSYPGHFELPDFPSHLDHRSGWVFVF